MANAKRQVLIVHGWSDSYESFQPLKSLLVAAGYQTTQVFLGTYASMRDDVTFDDLATGLQRRFVEMTGAGTLKLDPFSLDVIVHSTGGPVVRHWLNHYLRDVCGGVSICFGQCRPSPAASSFSFCYVMLRWALPP